MATHPCTFRAILSCAAPAIVLLPVAAGLGFTLLAACGYAPALGGRALSLAPLRALLAWPGFWSCIALTLRVGALSTAASLLLAVLVVMAGQASGALRLVLPPILAVPHVAIAIGFAFLIAPGGFLVRLVALVHAGWESAPPAIATVHDPAGLALAAGMVLKETPYLVLAMLAAWPQADAARTARAAAALGYGPARAFLLAVLPRLWPQMRLPVMAVLVFSLSVVDVSLVLGPDEPPTLGVQVVRLLSAPDFADWLSGCAGAMLLAGLCAAAVAVLILTERCVARAGHAVARGGGRGGGGHASRLAGRAALAALAATAAAALAILVLWAGAGPWRYPQALPPSWSAARFSTRLAGTGAASLDTVWIAAAASLAALVLAVLHLHHRRTLPGWWLFLPLLVPQPAFLWGQQVLLIRLRLDGGALALIWAHLVFVLPYVLLSLRDPWAALDRRHERAAASLGVPPWRVLVQIRLRLLRRPLRVALAVGFAVSVALYLPTVFAGAGRVTTLAMQAVAYASGPDRGLTAATALAQAMLPLAGFALALAGRR